MTHAIMPYTPKPRKALNRMTPAQRKRLRELLRDIARDIATVEDFEARGTDGDDCILFGVRAGIAS